MSQKGKGKADQKQSNMEILEVNTISDDDFMSGVNPESLAKMVKVGTILPQLKPKIDTVYTVKIVGNLTSFTSDYGKAFALEIEHNNMRKHMVFNPEGSFHLQLVALLTIHNLKLSQAKGRMISIQKTVGNTKKFKDVELYSVQFKQS